MSSDIDIEEHDLLDHPRIRQIFPDISNLKTEVEEIYPEETLHIVEDDTHYKSGPNHVTNRSNLKLCSNKIIIGSKPCTSAPNSMVTQMTTIQKTEPLELSIEQPKMQELSLEHTQEFTKTIFIKKERASNEADTIQETSFEEVPKEDKAFKEIDVPDTNILKTVLQNGLNSNKIILGTKTPLLNNFTSDKDVVKHLPEALVLLEDCSTFLLNNPMYCRDCKILFPLDSDLNAHKIASHSLLVAVSRNKAFKSTTKSNNRKSLLCNHCNIEFPNTIALLKHTYELLPGTFSCDQCEAVFNHEAGREAHQVNAHSKSAVKVENVATNYQCSYCSFKALSRRSYNVHRLKYHRNLHCNNSNEHNFENIPKFECKHCNMCLSSNYSLRIHLAARHGYLSSIGDSKKNIKSNDKSKKKLTVSKVRAKPIKHKKYTRNITKICPVPKSTLFKCDKCHVHFVSCVSAVLHARSCVPNSKKNHVSCHLCKRFFKLQDKLYHDYQHSISIKFKVIEISRNILNKILCKCRTCGVFFDENSFLTLHSNMCNAKSPSTKCKECNVMIHTKAVAVHNKIHANGTTSKDFIKTEYVHASATLAVKKQEKPRLHQSNQTNTFHKETVKIMETKGPVFSVPGMVKREKAYYYCPTCKCYMKMNRLTDQHYIGRCNKDVETVTCKTCGLSFTKKGIKTHSTLHKKFPKLKLKDIIFINIQNGNMINPPFPDFKNCMKCNVTFFSRAALNNHTCDSEESQHCTYCKANFSDLAYKLHLPFHEYAPNTNTSEDIQTNDIKMLKNTNIPELMKKYKSIKQVWNILYLCQTCNVVIDSYDKTVEHCQDHFSNMQSYNVTIGHCDSCDLNFVNDCYERHKKLHLNHDVNKDLFIILEYKYDNLLSDSWLNMFKNFSKEQLQLILSKSMYKFTRCARMKVISNGPFNLTLYQCAKCNAIVAPNKVMEHSQNVNNICVGAKQYACSICTLKFAYKSNKIVHENLHELQNLNVKSFRIIQFQADKQFSVTEIKNVTSKNNDPEELKFIRCQHCGKLINKQKYKSHIQYHESCMKKHKIKPGFHIESKHIRNVDNKVLNFYICKECKVCVAKESIKVHICDANVKKKKCDICYLWFRSQNLAAHYKSHQAKKFTRSNMKVMYFEGEVIKKPISKPFFKSKIFNRKTLNLYQCAKCSMCIWNKVNIQKHKCSSLNLQFTCNVCGFGFRRSSQAFHKEMHVHRQFDRSNITVVRFNGENFVESKTSSLISRKRKYSNSEELNIKKSKIHPREHLKRRSEKLKIETNQPTLVAKTDKIEENSSVANCVHQITNRYFKCRTCNTFFVTFSGLIKHEYSCVSDRETVKCQRCGLVFHASMIAAHLNTQECDKHTEENVYIITIQQKGIAHNFKGNWIFLCVTCGIHIISSRAFQYHLQNEHQTNHALQTCKLCQITFTSISHRIHLKMHHGNNETDISKLSIAAVEETTLLRILQNLPARDNCKSARKSKQNVITKPKLITDLLYTCDVCGLSFVHPRSLERHKETGRHDEFRKSCKVCGFAFTLISLKKHMSLHHGDHEIESNTMIGNIVLERNKCNSSLSSGAENDHNSDISVGADDINVTHVDSSQSTNHIKKSVRDSSLYNDTLVDNKTNGNSSKISKTNDNQSTEKADIFSKNIERTISDLVMVDNVLPSTSVDNISYNPTNETVNTEMLNKNKLFKCNICNVYFLTPVDCSEHMTNHIKLDNFEYIACKICNLQFCCEFVGRHMKSHREKSFSTEDLIVAEYDLNKDEVKINSYLYVDRLKPSVSTTINLDSEMVDSTTTEYISQNSM